MILAGELAAGEHLHEQALATRLGTSRGPVREAIRGLERIGLVVTVVNQGSYVRQVSEAEALELYEIRALLTGQSCAILARTVTPEQRRALRDLAQGMATAHEADDAAGYFALNRQFHEALLGFAGNARAARICGELGNELNLFRRRALSVAQNMRQSNAEHAAMLDAIEAGGPARARAAGERHIRGGKNRFTATRTISEAPDTGDLPQAGPNTARKQDQGRTTNGTIQEAPDPGGRRRPRAAERGGVRPS